MPRDLSGEPSHIRCAATCASTSGEPSPQEVSPVQHVRESDAAQPQQVQEEHTVTAYEEKLQQQIAIARDVTLQTPMSQHIPLQPPRIGIEQKKEDTTSPRKEAAEEEPQNAQ